MGHPGLVHGLEWSPALPQREPETVLLSTKIAADSNPGLARGSANNGVDPMSRFSLFEFRNCCFSILLFHDPPHYYPGEITDNYTRVNIKMNDAPEFDDKSFVVLSNSKAIAEGTLLDVARALWKLAQSDPTQMPLTFDRKTGAVVDLNISGSMHDVETRYAPQPEAEAKRGRPKLGVVAREITLLPRHWEWLAKQPGGASVTLRKLVEAARKNSSPEDDTRQRVNAAYKFMSAIGGDLPSFEEASRALFAGDFAKFGTCIAAWPSDIQRELRLVLHHKMRQTAE